MKAKKETHEVQAKDFMISTKKSLKVKDNAHMYLMDTNHTLPLPSSDFGSHSSLEYLQYFSKMRPANKTPNISNICREETDQ